MSVDGGSFDRHESQLGKALYDFTAGGDEEVQSCRTWLLCAYSQSDHECNGETVMHKILRVVGFIRRLMYSS